MDHVFHKDLSSSARDVVGFFFLSLHLDAEHWLIGYDSHFIILPVGKVWAQQGSVPPNGSPIEGRNRVP